MTWVCHRWGFSEPFGRRLSGYSRKPVHHDLRHFDALGTAGLTAGLSVERLPHWFLSRPG